MALNKGYGIEGHLKSQGRKVGKKLYSYQWVSKILFLSSNSLTVIKMWKIQCPKDEGSRSS